MRPRPVLLRLRPAPRDEVLSETEWGGSDAFAAAGWQHGGVAALLDAVRRRAPARIQWTPAFNRFTFGSALSGAGDALVAVSLAGSLFFSLSPDASREQVLLYLLINMAPFALLAPFVGPAIDHSRLGHRWISAIIFALRAACALALAFTLLDLALYFFALAMLIGAKAYGVVRQALVPELVVEPDHLVAANSRLARLNVVAGAIGGGIGGAVLAITGSPAATLALACAVFVAAGIACAMLPSIPARDAVTPSVEYEELHAPTIVATAWAFTVIRMAVGFFVFGLAFALRRSSEPTWMYGAAVAAYGVGTFLGNSIAPVLRRRFGEDRLTAGALAALALVLAFGALGPSRALVLLVSLVLGGVASVARQGFDAMVQTHAPAATRARSFARFETRFQLGWVAGAIAATAIAIPINFSLAVLAALLVPAAYLYVRALREGHEAHAEDPFEPVEVARRRVEHAVEWHRRSFDRLAVTELAGVVDLARATGATLDDAEVHRLEALRAAALSDQRLDPIEIDWAMHYAVTLAGYLGDDEGHAAAVLAEIVEHTPAQDTPAQDTPPTGSSSTEPPKPTEPVQESSTGSTDVDVTVQSDEPRATVSTSRDQSASDR